MDWWVVAAAAGAGCLAKFFQNISRGREGSSGFPSGSSSRDNSKSPILIQQTCETANGNHSDGTFAEMSQRDDSVSPEVASISALEHDKLEDMTMISSYIIPSESRKYEKFEDRAGCSADSDVSEIPGYPCWEMEASYGSERNKNFLRSKCLHLPFTKPRSSLDGCVMAQMHGEEAEIEDYLISPLVSPCTLTVSPFLVTDGRRVISRSSVDCRSGLHKEVHSKANDKVIGVPSLPKSREPDYSKLKLKGKNQTEKSSFASKLLKFDSQGSTSGQVLFSFGISFGIIVTVIANKLEVEKLKESLKQTENVAQDLHEEFEMKDSLTVKELDNNDDSQDTHENWCGNKKLTMFPKQLDTRPLIKCDDEESIIQKEAESMSKIEAELEEELERLEQSMKGPALKGRLFDDIEFEQEFDEDIMAELVHGELDANIVRQRSSSEPSPDQGSGSPSTPITAKQGVSPHELCLRLHEVIRSRLEKRIKELEAELAKSQRRVQHLESERINPWRDISNSESSSTWGSPITIEAHGPITLPLVLNLSGNALDACSEAFKELDKLKGSLNASSKIRTENEHCDLTSTNQNGFRDGAMTWAAIRDDKPLSDSLERIPSSATSPHCYGDEDDVYDLLLIKQIVEKARQGSPAVLRAQRALVYLNKDED
ncbi:hypothetical protein Cgig2_017876 [Carnegiea gigantea]|uniref:Uncharacterized protein n=1 Tax=Carnegiea gigantea TaxID=171969 RepID=A0A9Q1QT94_9CARY|nr:hypothetical protein Cgig2_017876 [Carnegiea gigantea]